MTYSMVRAYILQRRSEIRVEEGRGPPLAFVPQTHRPVVEAEVDHVPHQAGIIPPEEIRELLMVQRASPFGLLNRADCGGAAGGPRANSPRLPLRQPPL